MNIHKSRLLMTLLIVVIPTTNATAQKVKVGYDKSTNFSQYKSYTLAEPNSPPTRPLLYAAIIGSIDHELRSKGLARTQNDGDLILISEGATEHGLNQHAGSPILPTYSGAPPAINATMWTGGSGYAASLTTYVPEGMLRVDFIDRSANKVVWSGTVKVKLDMEKRSNSFKLADKAVLKLLKEFPPAKK